MRWFPNSKKTAKKSEDDYKFQKDKLLQEIQRINSEIQRRKEETSSSDKERRLNQQQKDTSFGSKEPVLVDADESNHLIEQVKKEEPPSAEPEPEDFIIEHKINLRGCVKWIQSLFPGNPDPKYRYLSLDGRFGKLTTGAERRIIRKKFWLLVSICVLLALAILSMVSKL